MLSKSSGLTPTRLPVGKFRSGADVSIPSTSCTNLVFASVEKPLVFIAAKFKLPRLTFIPFICSSWSTKSAVAAFWISSKPIFSIVTGASSILCSILEADTTTSFPSSMSSDISTSKFEMLDETSISWVL